MNGTMATLASMESSLEDFARCATAERAHTGEVSAEWRQGLGRLLESAMDAMIELDSSFRILSANASAGRLLNVPSELLPRRSLRAFLSAPALQKLSLIAQQLNDPEQPHAWVPRGLEVVRSNGACFPAEATVSRFEVAGEIGYGLVLRDVHEQLVAESCWYESDEESAYAESEIDHAPALAEMVGNSSAMREVKAAILKVAVTPATVLITGESGTGKELVARAIHHASPRAGKAFVRVNCAAIAATLCESEFFGHEKGAFTGAATRRTGRFELAQNGTIFLDEIGELPLELQPKLLRVLQEGEYEAVGSSQTRKVDVRVITATNRNLAADVAAGRFREDLFYRLNVFPIAVPALRDRDADIELLALRFLERFRARMGRPPAELTSDCRRRLRAYDWPGNVRELENTMERAVITAGPDGAVSLRNVLPSVKLTTHLAHECSTSGRPLRTKRELRGLERDLLVRALERAGWKVAGPDGAALALGLPPSTLTSRMRALQIERPRNADSRVRI